MKYLNAGGFSVASPGTQQYRDNWDAIFTKKPVEIEKVEIVTNPPGCQDPERIAKLMVDRLREITYVDEPKSEFVGVDRSQSHDETNVAIWTKEIEATKKEVERDLWANRWKDDRDPLELGAVQRRIRDWAEHNFPLKVTDEHKRIAREFVQREWNTRSPQETEYWCAGEVERLAYLLASRESRSHRMLLGACEELGELCHAHLKNEQCIRGTPEEWRESKKDAIGDTLIYLMDYCNKEGLDIEECLQMALDEIATRDWVRFPKNGKTE